MCVALRIWVTLCNIIVIIFIAIQGNVPVEMPPWMQYLHKKLDQAESHHNIRLFICKLIVNMQEVFRPYAKYWLCPIVRFVTTGYWGAEPMNYFVTDLVTTILSWHTVAIPDVSTLLEKNF